MTTHQRKRAGRPPKYTADTKPRHLSIRIPATLFARLEAAATEQQTNVTYITAQALEAFLGAQAALDLDIIAEGLLGMGEAASALETHCNACITCRPHITTTINAAWPKLTAALDALPTTKQEGQS
jgi:predicted transcriptional regulator